MTRTRRIISTRLNSPCSPPEFSPLKKNSPAKARLKIRNGSNDENAPALVVSTKLVALVAPRAARISRPVIKTTRDTGIGAGKGNGATGIGKARKCRACTPRDYYITPAGAE